jgi:hypothetical protein
MAHASGSSSVGPGPHPLPASPFKRDDTARLSEENLMKMSRSTSGINKRGRKVMDDDHRADSDLGPDTKKAVPRVKRNKYGHNTYKSDLEDAAMARRNGLLPTAAPARSVPTPTSNPQASQYPSYQRPVPVPKRRKITISGVVASTSRFPRRHLGFFRYEPTVEQPELNAANPEKSEVSIKPNLLPSFADADHINCTYTVKVSSLWLQHKERHVIGREQCLWGTGIYTDDSDPVAAAMHSGFIASALPNDAALDRIIEEQNLVVDGLKAPPKPMPVPEGKDLHITLVVLPQLDFYADSVRFGVKSRKWPTAETIGEERPKGAPHDGVSFMVLKTEFINDGVVNRRIGRTGVEKRARLQRELASRKRALELRDLKIAQQEARLKEKTKKKKQQTKSDRSAPKTNGVHVEKTSIAEKENVPVTKQTATKDASPDVNGAAGEVLDGVGESPDAWIRQLKDAGTDGVESS